MAIHSAAFGRGGLIKKERKNKEGSWVKLTSGGLINGEC